MNPTNPGFTPAELDIIATARDIGDDVMVDPASILALLDDLESAEAQCLDVNRAMERERDTLRARVAAVKEICDETQRISAGGSVLVSSLRAALAKGGA